jgi:PAS domain S-box-containing protein
MLETERLAHGLWRKYETGCREVSRKGDDPTRGALRASDSVMIETATRSGIAHALSTSVSLTDAATIVTQHAMAALRASGVHVEHGWDPHAERGWGRPAEARPPRTLEVLAAVGVGVPPVGLCVPYPGSLTPDSIESLEPESVGTDCIGWRPGPPLSSTAPRSGTFCPSLVVPLTSEGQVHGALVLRRLNGDTPFTGDDVLHARVLGDLAAAALWRNELVAALRESENRFRQIADNIHEFIWLSDPEFTTHFYVNPAYERIWGRSREGLHADPTLLLDGVHPDDRERVEEALLGMPRGEYDIEFRVVRPDADVRWVSSRGVPVRNERGEIQRIAGITEDITDRKQVEVARRRLLERERAAREASEEALAAAELRQRELKRVTESRTRLIRGFTHDVKNPLGAANGFLALLTEGVYGALEPPQVESIERARHSIRSALDLVTQALDMARAEAGELLVNRMSTDVRVVIFEIAEEFRAQATTARLSLALELPPSLPEIESDPARIRQVLANLLSNAVKYTPGGGSITIRADACASPAAPRPGEWVVVDVIDTGKGIAADQQPHLFEEFARFEPDAAEGAGIGLAISQRVAQALGGVIRVDSRLDAGSTFSLWLPASRETVSRAMS